MLVDLLLLPGFEFLCFRFFLGFLVARDPVVCLALPVGKRGDLLLPPGLPRIAGLIEGRSERMLRLFHEKGRYARDAGEEGTRKVAQSMIRAALYVCLERDPLRYYDFLARTVLKSTPDERDRAKEWAMRIVEEKGL